MSFQIREIQICGQAAPAFTDQTHPQIAVLTGGGMPEKLTVRVRHGRETDWELQTAGTVYLSYAGNDLKPKTEYQIEITASRGGEVSSASAVFYTGFLNTKWEASWIEPVQESALREPEILFYQIFNPKFWGELDESRLRPARQIRKRFFLSELPWQAVLYATAHGVYTVQVNACRVDERVLAPEISAYHKRLYYQRYDVTSCLKQGENELLFTVADGWWSGRIGLSGDSCQYGDRLGLLAQLELQTGEEITVIPSDGSFEGRESQIDYADLYIGERRDLTKPLPAWQPCQTVDCSQDNLVAQSLAPLHVTQSIPGRLFRSPKGDLLADFGQVLAGVVRLSLSSLGKKCVTIEHCETLDAHGEFFRNIVGRNKQQTDTLICDTWPVVFQPDFTYHGFRYVRIKGVSEAEIDGVEAQVIGSPLRFYGSFACSDPRLNQLQHNIQWSMRGNFVSIPTDCPQREKMGWTGDIQVFTPTAAFNADVRGFLGSWLDNMKLEQRETGEIPNYIPAFPISDGMQRNSSRTGDNTSSAWGDSCILVPLYLYRQTGDLDLLRDAQPMMEGWLNFIQRELDILPDGYDSLPPEEQVRCPYLWRSGHHFGDWLIPSFMGEPDGTHKGVAATAEVISYGFYAVTLRAYLEVLSLLGQTGACYRELSARLEKVKVAFREQFVSPEGIIKGDLQGLYVIALYAGIAEGPLREKLAERLVRLIRENGDRLDTGFVTTPYLLQTLCDCGYRELAYQLLLQEKAPSWLYQVKIGATAIWENWTAILEDGSVTTSSLNHYSLGSVGAWMYAHIGGISEVDMANGTVLFAPDTDTELLWGGAATEIPCGSISCRWNRDVDAVHIEIESPLDCKIRLRGCTVSLKAGSYTAVQPAPGAEIIVLL